MLIEERVYKIQAGRIGEYLSIYDAGPRALQQQVLGNLIGYFITEIGGLSSLVHLWGFETFEDRMARRGKLAEEPLWQEYLRACTPMIQSMDNRILVPTAFSPIR